MYLPFLTRITIFAILVVERLGEDLLPYEICAAFSVGFVLEL